MLKAQPLAAYHTYSAKDKVGGIFWRPFIPALGPNDGSRRSNKGSPGSIRRYTGDRHEVGNIRGAFLLVATPEALESLQLMQPDVLGKVRSVVIDEAHCCAVQREVNSCAT